AIFNDPLPPDASATLTLTFNSTQPGTLTETATASANEEDPHPVDNTTSASTTVVPPRADLQVSVVAPATVPLVGLGFTHTLTVHNAGPQPATGLTLVVHVSANADIQLLNFASNKPASISRDLNDTVTAIFNDPLPPD